MKMVMIMANEPTPPLIPAPYIPGNTTSLRAYENPLVSRGKAMQPPLLRVGEIRPPNQLRLNNPRGVTVWGLKFDMMVAVGHTAVRCQLNWRLRLVWKRDVHLMIAFNSLSLWRGKPWYFFFNAGSTRRYTCRIVQTVSVFLLMWVFYHLGNF